jgi:hypothetical protein
VKKISAKTSAQRYRQAQTDQKRANRGAVIRAGMSVRMVVGVSNALVCDAVSAVRDIGARL